MKKFTKSDLRRSFERGEDFAVYQTEPCFNRWFNETYLDSEKCKICFHNGENDICSSCKNFSQFKKKI